MQRIHITRNQPGPRVTFKHNEDTGAYIVKEGWGDIYWYRYQEKVLKLLLLPFAKRCCLSNISYLPLVIVFVYKRGLLINTVRTPTLFGVRRFEVRSPNSDPFGVTVRTPTPFGVSM